MTDDSPSTHECLSGEPGHAIHDCELGDGSTWTRDPCNSHDDCDGSETFALRILNGDDLDPSTATRLVSANPDLVSYERGSAWLFVKGCRGEVIGAKAVVATD